MADRPNSEKQVVREHIRDWPHVPGYLLETLDHEMISSHGEALLMRALQSERVVTFLGSGVSMAYGRLGWGAWVRHMLKSVLANAEEFKEDERIERLILTLKELDIYGENRGDYLQSGRFPAVFQFMELLADATKAADLRKNKDRSPRGNERLGFREQVMQALHDDRGHARLLIRELLDDMVQIQKPGQIWLGSELTYDPVSKITESERNLSTVLDKLTLKVIPLSGPEEMTSGDKKPPSDPSQANSGEKEEISERCCQWFFWRASDISASKERMMAVTTDAELKNEKEFLFKVVIDALKLGASTSKRLLPAQRFIIPALARLNLRVPEISKSQPKNTETEQPPERSTNPISEWGDVKEDSLVQSLLNISQSISGADSHTNLRSHYLPAYSSPLAVLTDGLGIRRFLTTNYDVDIEKMLQERGFAPIWSNGDVSRSDRPRFRYTNTSDPLGALASERVFSASKAAELIDFAIADEDKAYDLMHLHGRAVPGEQMIVTESDYQQQYLQAGENGEIVRDALGLAFGANVNFFVGNGMSEDDILRPMRHFLSNRNDISERVSIALLPSDKTRAVDIEQTLALYTRYAAHVIHFGNIPREDKPNVIQFRWLEKTLLLISDLKKVFEAEIRFLLNSEKKNFENYSKLKKSIKNLKEESVGSNNDLNNLSDEYEKNVENWFLVENVSRLDRVDGRRSEEELLPLMECELLRRALCCALKLEKKEKPSANWLPLLLAYKSILKHLPDALIGACLCIKLNALGSSLMVWKHTRRSFPGIREPQHPNYGITIGQSEARWLSRHAIALREPINSTDMKLGQRTYASGSDRFFLESPSRAMKTFLESVTQKRSHMSLWAARRVYVLVGPRGIGKGHFFECLGHQQHLKKFVETSWEKPIEYAAFSLMNLSFSHEVISPFDSISDLLVKHADRVYESDVLGGDGGPAEGSRRVFGAKLEEISRQFQRDRIGRLEALLSAYGKNGLPKMVGGRLRARLLVAVNGFNLLFDRSGIPKNAQLARVVNALFGALHSDVPIDFLVVCGEVGFPAFFRSSMSGSARDDAGGSTMRAVNKISGPVKLHSQDRYGDQQGGAALSFSAGVEETTNQYPWKTWHRVGSMTLTHLERTDITERGKRDIAELLHRLQVHENGHQSHPSDDLAPAANFIHVLWYARASALMAKYFPEAVLAVAMARELKPDSSVLLSDWNGALKRHVQEAVSRHLQGEEEGPYLPHEMVYLEVLRKCMPSVGGFHGIEGYRELDGAGKLDAYFRQLFSSLQRSRVLITVVAAVTTEFTNFSPARNAGQPAFNAQAGKRWLDDIQGSVRGLAQHQVADRILDEVFNQYRIRHEDGSKIPIHLESSVFKDLPYCGSLYLFFQTPAGWQLQQRILWHMALVGDPIEADVLVTAPLIRADIERWISKFFDSHRKSTSPSGTPADQKPDPISLCKLALELLVHRCLIFRLEPSGANSRQEDVISQEIDTGWRFAMHRLVQKNILNKLRSPDVEFPEIDFYSMSMWATQPDDLPRPHADAAREISDLTTAWMGFPADRFRIEAGSVYHSAVHEAGPPQAGMAVRTLPARLLRACLGIIRSVYSVGVVSRFHDFAGVAAGDAPAGGYFEEHRHKLGWLIKNIKELPPGPSAEEISGEVASSTQHPFLSEEVAWLYNECGLVCLVQGRVPQAVDLFRQALRVIGARLEPEGRMGALTARIHLNLGVMEIERGRAQGARRYLCVIRDLEDENPIIRLIARGLLALTDHLAGKLDLASREYEVVIDLLERRGKSRAVAVFCRHLSELYRLKGPDARSNAWQTINRAIASASKGGHEDILHFCRLSRVRLVMDDPSSTEKSDIQRQLDVIETYAQTMGIRRMLAEVAYARATLLLQMGETRHAARHACNCLRIATQMELRLRQVTALSLLAKIYARRGNESAARLLKARASALADTCGYVTAKASV